MSADRRLVEVALRNGKASAANGTIVVKQHELVELRWRSDRPIDLHLHGYDLHAAVTPAAPNTMTFTARLPGRFPISEHRRDSRHHAAVAYLEVHP